MSGRTVVSCCYQLQLLDCPAELSRWPNRARGLAAGASGAGSRAARLSRCRAVQPSHLTALYAAMQTAAQHEAAAAAAAVAAKNRRQEREAAAEHRRQHRAAVAEQQLQSSSCRAAQTRQSSSCRAAQTGQSKSSLSTRPG